MLRRARTLASCLAPLALAAGCGLGGGPAPSAATGTATAPADLPAADRAAAQRADADAAAAQAAHRRAQREGPLRVTVLSGGDLLIHRPIWERARQLGGGRDYDFAPLLRHLRPYVAGADLAICHLEVPLTSRPPSGFPLFNAPPALARALRATGWDACTTASNHTLDQGAAGVAETVAALDRAGLRHTGAFATARGARRTLLLDVRGARVALLAYTTTTNGIPLPRPWSVNLADPARIARDARRARRRGADAVIVNLHWGDEYVSRPSAAQLALARRLARVPAITAIVGQHAHVVQPIRWVGRLPVVFGAGNLISNQTAACCAPGSQDGLLAQLELVVDRRRPHRTRVTRVRYVPIWVRHPDYAVLPVGDALRRGLADGGQLRASWARTVAVAGRGGRVAPVPERLP